MAFSLQAVFGVDATGIKTGLKQARSELNNFSQSVLKLGSGLAFGAFVALGKGAIDLAGHLSDTAQNIGINVESLQALYAQSQKNGVGQAQLDKALEKTKAAVIGAAQGNKTYSDALAVLKLRGSALLDLPLDKQYALIAKQTANAEDKAAAYAAVSVLLGEKVGPKLMTSLNELGTEGFDKVMKGARAAGQVMSAETIVALDRAGDAIDDFKKKATVAVGNIIVNFRSEEGLKLLGLKLMKIAGEFGGTVLDALVEANDMIGAVMKGTFRGVSNLLQDGLVNAAKAMGAAINLVLPKKYEINVSNLDQFLSTGKSVGDEITEAIAKTSPSTFKKDFSESWGQAVNQQQAVVDKLNKVDLGPEAKKLTDSGKAIKTDLSDGAKGIKAAGAPLVEVIEKSFIEWNNVATSFGNSAREFGSAATSFSGAMSKISRTGLSYQEQSTQSLMGVIERLQAQFSAAKNDTSGRSAFSPDGKTASYYAFQSELFNAQKELSMRQEVADFIARNGQDAAVRQYGDTLVQRAQDAISAAQRETNHLLTGIDQSLKNFLAT